MVLIVVLAYFSVLLAISHFSARGGDNSSFFTGGRRSPWYMVAFGMVGASISGVTFVSVPGMVLHSGMTYLQTCMGFILGYFAVAYVLLPIYYRMNLTSIYTVLRGINDEAYKTGALFFIVSKLLGSAAKFFVPCFIISGALGISFPVTVILLLSLIWLYTRKGGIKTLVWTDSLQTLCMLVALGLIIYNVYGALDFNGVGECLSAVAASDFSQVFEFTAWDSPNNFFKCFVSGMFIVIVMTGLDQDMMQKNLTCKNLRDAQKDMCTYGFAFVPVNALFLVLGVLLTMLYAKNGMALPDKPDALLSGFVFGEGAGSLVLVFFILGIIATSFSTVDSALTALTTTFCVDILGASTQEGVGENSRRRVHAGMTIALICCTVMFNMVSTTSLIDVIYRLVSYTYGPLLGLFAYGLKTTPLQLPQRGRDKKSPLGGFCPSGNEGNEGSYLEGSCRGFRGGVLLVCIASPLICLALDYGVPLLTGYHFGYELLLLNGLITYGGLCLVHSS